MAVQYWVGEFFVDLSRNQVTQKEQSQTIAPKALAVLTYLAENQGRVVSYDELFAKVWPDTIVTPNTLQRSIAQLRKVLGQDTNLQSYIKTHAKQGYSLECDVKWHDEAKPETAVATGKDLAIADSSAENEVSNTHVSTETDAADKAQPPRYSFKLIIAVVGIVILAIIGFSYLTPTQSLKLSFGELRSLTATDNKEHSAIYSPDGEYFVFLRYSEEFCNSSNLWAKNIKTQQETQLTKNMGRYGSHSFSKDGKKLVFIKTENCNKPMTQKDCYKLMTLDFEKALAAPQSPNLLMECKNSRITKATWLNNNNIALLQEFANRWKLTSYSIADNKSTVIYELEDGNFVDYDYSATDDLIALTSIHNDGLHYIEIIKPDGQVLSSHPIEYPPEIANFRNIYPNFTPTSELLIFSTGRQLFTLSYDGKITNISLPLDEPMGSPIFHPDGKRALVIKGNWDSDIATISLSQITKSQSAKAQSTQTQADQSLTRENNSDSNPAPIIPVPTILERSTLAEDNAIYQPKGELIAFKSTRFGDNQIWITHGNGAQQLSNFPMDSSINGMNWAADGQSILVNVNNSLTQATLDSSQKSFPFDHRIEQLFHWDSEDNTALLLVRIKGVLKFGEFNLHNSEFRVITDKKVNWALKSEDGRLIYTDQLDRFWQPGPAEDRLIESLESQGSDKRFIIKNNVIYGINEEFQLWSYDLNEDTFETLGNIPNNVDSLTDINQSDILLTLRITAKKEVAELTLRD
ncbi:winged helix-turn-helix domain-containing protein [Colwellia piezophila]|uniref:winged helix-turn-helix domain-containing protein n=1 Tax=Colwellia piezophila TaxID=211668 RepID=UPI000361D30D|nr:winged helix-turn-helix domain-containing protein [Colwellia piezophila]